MLKLTRYLKPFIGWLLAAVLLIFVQAMCDLRLPDYMSDIVNVGIQQGGMDSAVPDELHQSKMEQLQLFMTESDAAFVNENYTLRDVGDPAKNHYIQNEKLNKESTDRLTDIFDNAFVVTGTLDMLAESPDALEELAKQLGNPDMAITTMPGGSGFWEILASMPVEARLKIAEEITKEYATLGDAMLSQTAVTYLKAEYEAAGIDMGKMQQNYIFTTGLMMLAVALVAAASTVVVTLISAKIGAGIAKNLRRDVYGKVTSFSNAEFDKFSTASLITRTTNDITQVQMLVTMMIRMVIYAPIMGIGGTLYAIEKSKSMAWIIALAVVVLISVVVSIFLIATPKFKIMQKLVDRLNQVTRENLSGLMVIRAYNTQEFEENRFDKANNDLTQTNLFAHRVMTAMMPMMMLIMNGVTLLIIWVGAKQISEAQMQVGDMMAYIQYAMQVVMSFLMISMMFIMIPRASVAGDRIAEVLNTELSIKSEKNTVPLKNTGKQGLVEFKDVSFRFPGAEEDTLHNITFTAKPGETTAFIGSTGSGKSTLINLIPRFYDVTGGEILVNGVDVRKADEQELRDQIGYVPQKAVLFSGTIGSNLRYGDENASEETVSGAAAIAQATDFIQEKTEGYDSAISQGGTNVSGGQKQRLSIARALVKKPPIYIFDDSFSALDFKTDAALRKALKVSTGDSTILLVAQRVGTIRHAEQIIVLDEGCIAGKGTHDELMTSCEIYRDIAYSQLSKEELA